jgi:hypothetical protein
MKIYFVFVCLMLSALNALGQEAKPLSLSQVALRADALVLFVPRGWKIEKQKSGDLNRDKKPDAVLVLVGNKSSAAARQRALVVLLREGKGWHLTGFNNSLLLGTRDGGAFYGVSETPVDVSIQQGVLIVEQESGSREVEHTTHKFRFDARQSRMLFIGLT